MPIQDAVPALIFKGLRTDTAATDAGELEIPFTGKGYTVRRVTVYNSRNIVTGATVDGALATLSVRGGAGGTGTSIVADAALTGLSSSSVVLDRTVAATGVTPIVDDSTLYLRVGTASGVANSAVDVVVVIEPLP